MATKNRFRDGTSYQYDGILYQIEYQPHLSNHDYTTHTVYHIKTEDESYPHTHGAIVAIMNDGSWTEEYYKHINKVDPSFANYLHSYHEFSFNEALNVFVYTLVRPYDD